MLHLSLGITFSALTRLGICLLDYPHTLVHLYFRLTCAHFINKYCPREKNHARREIKENWICIFLPYAGQKSFKNLVNCQRISIMKMIKRKHKLSVVIINRIARSNSSSVFQRLRICISKMSNRFSAEFDDSLWIGDCRVHNCWTSVELSHARRWKWVCHWLELHDFKCK